MSKLKFPIFIFKVYFKLKLIHLNSKLIHRWKLKKFPKNEKKREKIYEVVTRAIWTDPN